MERSLKQVILPDSGYKVMLVENLLYGEFNTIQHALLGDTRVGLDAKPEFSAASVGKFKETKLLTCVKKIVDADGKELPISMETFNNLSITDGQLLELKCDNLFADVKKK